MDYMKYVVYDNGLFSAPVIFPNNEDHADFSKRLGIHKTDILSAGFVQISEGSIEVFGESHSLGIQSNPEDVRLINRMLGNK